MCELCEGDMASTITDPLGLPIACVAALSETLRGWIRGVAFNKDPIAYLDRWSEDIDAAIDELAKRAKKWDAHSVGPLTWDDVAMLEDLDRPDLASRIAALLPPQRG